MQSEGGAVFTLRLLLSLRPTPIWASNRLDLVPCSPFSESPFRGCAPLGPLAHSLALSSVPLQSVTVIATPLSSGRRSPFRPMFPKPSSVSPPPLSYHIPSATPPL